MKKYRTEWRGRTLRWLGSMGAAFLIVFAATGCQGGVIIRPDKPKDDVHGDTSSTNGHKGHVVVIGKGHRHSPKCGHYRHKGKWFLHKGHHHKKHCGHVFRKGFWVRVS